MTVRALIVTLALGVLVGPVLTAAQPRGSIPRVGVLSIGPQQPPAPCLLHFQQGLRDLGYVEGQTILLEYRYGEFQPDRLAALAAELVQLQPDVIWTTSTQTALALTPATSTIPIVVGSGGDLVAAGLVDSRARPGGNLTGLETRNIELLGKHVELLQAAVPQLSRVAILVDPAERMHDRVPSTMEAEARALGVQLQRVEAGTPDAFEAAFAAMAAFRAEALVIVANPFLAAHRQRLLALALAQRLPTIAAARSIAEAGSLLSYGVNQSELCQRSALYVDKMLKGARPADLPVEGPMKFEFIINLKTARALGLTIPPTLLFQANEVLQ